MADRICANCGTLGKPVRTMRGSIWIEIVLWLSFLVPGIIYSLWRLTTKSTGCRVCGSENLVPVNSPVGRDLMSRYHAAE